MSEPGLTLTQQPPLSPLVELRADDTAHRLWRDIARSDAFQEMFVAAVGDLVGDLDHHAEREEWLREHGVTALDGVYAGMVPSLARTDDQFFEVLRATAQFGAPTRSVAGWHLPLKELADGPLAILRASEHAPTVTIHIDDGFEDLHASEQRPDVIWLLAELARNVDLRIVATGRWQRKLATEYRERLPAVSEQCNAGPSAGVIAERVELAREALDPDGRKIRILRQLAAETGETLSYNGLYSLHEVSRGAVRQCLTTGDRSLADLGLVETFSRSATRGNAVELLAAGRELLETFDSEIGRQQHLEAVVSDSGNRSDDSRVTPPAHEGPHRPATEAKAVSEQCSGDVDDRNRLPFRHQVRSAARHRYAAATGSATDGEIALVDHPISEKDDRAEPHWYYDSDDDRLLVGAEYDDPMQWWVCVALALADQRTFRHILTPSRFESGKLGDLLENHTDLLRNSRCLGYLKDADATAEGYTKALLKAAEDLRELTRDLHHDNYKSRNRFRGTITREALGLAGTLVHLMDLADVEVVREARIPRFSRDFKESHRRDLAETVAVGASIQSRYREFAAYRQLFEPREEKREWTFPPTVNADDPFGELIGSFVLVGPSVDDIADSMRRRLANRDTHEDAPEFGVPIRVEGADKRRHTSQTVQKMCQQKSLRPTRTATSMLAALTGTPYDVARALHNLGSEVNAPNREIRLDEVRYGLATLNADRIFPDMSKPALSKIVHSLLTAKSPLIQSELAERANVSARSVRNHTERLMAFDFVRETEDGLRFALPFHTDDERGETIFPWFAATDDSQNQETVVRDVLGEVVYELLAADRYADPDDPVAGALFNLPGEVIPNLRETWEWLNPWISTIRMALRTEGESLTEKGAAIVGETPQQASVVAVTRG